VLGDYRLRERQHHLEAANPDHCVARTRGGELREDDALHGARLLDSPRAAAGSGHAADAAEHAPLLVALE